MGREGGRDVYVVVLWSTFWLAMSKGDWGWDWIAWPRFVVSLRTMHLAAVVESEISLERPWQNGTPPSFPQKTLLLIIDRQAAAA